MPKISKLKKKCRKASEIGLSKRKEKKIIRDIIEKLNNMNQSDLQETYQTICQLSDTKDLYEAKQHKTLINTIQQYPENQLKPVTHLLNTMKYTKGQNKGNILSPFLQDKAHA